ncbi:MAG: ATP-binding cassette domain-containing protein [Dethiobacter sp.]|nr:MAG: ATP-binding cassette domain-containing protein [Dethiobacter sp.]
MLKVKIKKKMGNFTLHKQWEVDKGEIVTLFGPSGSGKTLTIKCIAGLLKPDHGIIEIDDKVLFNKEKNINLAPQQRRVGYVPQHFALFPHLSVEANVVFALGNCHGKSKKHVVDNLLESVGLEDKKRKLPCQLSGGEKQRVAIIRAMATEPMILLLDEPFAAVDVPMRNKLREEIKIILRRLNIPVVLVSHDPEDIVTLDSKIVNY